VKYDAFRRRLDAVEARLGLKRAVVKIEGGLPPDWKPPAAAPPGSDLKYQAQAFGKPRPAAGPSVSGLTKEAGATPSPAAVEPQAKPAKRAG
jgi:hypothetical protein